MVLEPECQDGSNSMESSGKVWQARWITGKEPVDDDCLVPPYHFLKQFSLQAKILSAKLCATALGCYSIKIDGHDISACYFAPGYTQYTKRVLYNTYDVAELLHGDGLHLMDVEVSGGWYAGRLGLSLKRNRFGKKRAFMMEMQITYEDGQTAILATDETWEYSIDGPRRFADFFDGEIYDANREDMSMWTKHPVDIYTGVVPDIEEAYGCLVCKHEKLIPTEIRTGRSGEQIFCFSRNIAGIISLQNVEGRKGQEITVAHGELLIDGVLSRENLRSAKAELHYICRDGMQSYEPRFTYMGFQYVCVTGAELTTDQICAWELYSDMEQIGSFSCSDARLNQLQQNILTSQKANFVDIPTDCPQRDERCGWTGDISVFAPTAVFNMDAGAFLRKWCRDMVLCQERGIVPMIVPDGGFGMHGLESLFGLMHKGNDAVWGDAIILVPWAVYQSTGDIQILKECYDGMKAWLSYVQRQCAKPLPLGANRCIWSWGFHFGDWLAPGESLFENIKKAKWTSTAYFANSAKLLGQIAGILGQREDEKIYGKLFADICTAFRKKFVGKDRHIKKGFQSIYALALRFGLLSEEEATITAMDLNEDVIRHGYHLTTGFAGTPAILFALSDFGYADTAYRLLLQESCPGWLYPVLCDATSIWERWDALLPNGDLNESQVGNGNMVSLNHYAYGAVGEWLYRRIGGIEPTEAGYRTIRIAPVLGGGITWAKCSHKTPYGILAVHWWITETVFYLDVTIPKDTQAEIVMPDGRKIHSGAGQHHFEGGIL